MSGRTLIRGACVVVLVFVFVCAPVDVRVNVLCACLSVADLAQIKSQSKPFFFDIVTSMAERREIDPREMQGWRDAAARGEEWRNPGTFQRIVCYKVP